MRDIDTTDNELRVLVSICNTVREMEGRTPGTAFIDGLPNERRKMIRAQALRH